MVSQMGTNLEIGELVVTVISQIGTKLEILSLVLGNDKEGIQVRKG